MFSKISRKEIVFSAFFVILILILWVIPTGFEKQIYYNAQGCEVEILTVDNSLLIQTGMMKQGEQKAEVRILSGKHKGEISTGTNYFVGKLSQDKVFAPGDRVFALVEMDKNDGIVFINLVDHYRFRGELILVIIFAALLLIILGFSGFRTLLSFMFALLALWKILIPFMLKGYPPLLVALLVGNIITVATLLLVAGFTRRAYAAIFGSILTSLLVCILAVIASSALRINGVVMTLSESLLYSGYQNLNLTGIYQGAIYLACSGAILDLAIDISAALYEVQYNRPDISSSALIKSGLRIGKSVVGSQTTTLLLAYMGSFITVLMVFTAQGTPMASILTSKEIASEILTTIIGCIGLVLVTPLTSILCGFYFTSPGGKASILKDISKDGLHHQNFSD